MGTPLGTLAGLAMGGVIADAYGWRTAFLIAGVPGLLLAVVCLFTLREPRNALTLAARRANETAQMTFSATLRYLSGKRTFWCMASARASAKRSASALTRIDE